MTYCGAWKQDFLLDCSVCLWEFGKNKHQWFYCQADQAWLVCLIGVKSFTKICSKHAKQCHNSLYGGVMNKFPADSYWYVILRVIFSSSYPLLPGVSLGWWDFWKGVRGCGASRAGSGGGEVTGLNPHRLTAEWCFCFVFLSEIRHPLLQIELWPLHTDGAFKGLGAKSSCDKIFYLKFKMLIPFSVLRAFLNPWIHVIWYYNARRRGIRYKFPFFLKVTS